ncbi:hypothetical protein PRZ48_000517 [Zasmidium cellare]|uniref:GAR domain-containing protein n=1 Tax=Zasmidium cellare TaxID=395010 RepID=A0ABR0EYQ5_ZASCE|nr:hypothetical protein PRZ48_000517 [Zasmidium cellare]
MHPGNPFTNAPALPRPKGHLHSRSISRSPVRQHARDFDPLLRDLSPTTTLRAFVTDPEDMGGKEPDVLMKTVQTTSISERALGAKAAQACLDLRAWTRELEGWQWSGTFDVPEPARKKIRISNAQSSTFANESDADEEFWGSLPAKTVQAYERRADEIGHSLDQINVEELKDYVLNSHYRVESRPQSRDDSFSTNSATTDMKRLDDYTAVVTATILHALPFLSKLNRLLDTWTIRLIILRSVPNYLGDLKQARTDLDEGWAALAVPSSASTNPNQVSFDRKVMEEMKGSLEAQVSSLGGKLDRFLDSLEGRDDSLPDTWIDDFELLESAYGTWVVQAERKVLENEWRASIHRTELEAPPARTEGEGQRAATPNIISELEDPALDHDAVRRLSMRSTDAAGFLASSRELPAATNGAPKLGSHAVQTSAGSGVTELDACPVPILVANDGIGNGDSDPTSAVEQQDLARVPSSGSVSKEDGMGQVAKRRAQFLNDIERNQSLKTSKSPVRPFEHASNAFTRLFKKDRSPEQVKPKRTTSNKWNSSTNVDDRSVSAERNPLSPVSVASSKFNTTSLASSAQSPASTSKTSRIGSDDVEPVQAKQDPPTFEQYDTGESHEEPPYYAQDHYREINDILRDDPQPSNLSSPFHSPAKASPPKDWPLASPADTPQEGNMVEKQAILPPSTPRGRADSGPEVSSPDVLRSDDFDRMFIESLPGAPDERPGSARAPTRTIASAESPRRPASLPRNMRKHMPELSAKYAGSYLDNVSVNNRRPGSSSGPPNGVSRSENALPMPRPSSKDQGNTSTIGDGNDYFESGAVDTSRSLKLEIPQNDSKVERPAEKRPQAAKRASIASIEAFPRSQLKTIDVPRMSRRSSASPGITPPQTPPRSREASTTGGAETVEAGPMSFKGMVAFPTPPPRRASASSRATPPLPVNGKETPTVLRSLPRSSPAKSDVNGSPLANENVSPSAPLNAAMAKRRGKSTLRVENSPSSPNSSPQKTTHSRAVEEDSFDRHVSEVLETLPGQIRFTPRAGAETPSTRLTYSGPRPKITSGRSSRAGMTIAPAEASPKKTTSASEPEVKLYHLTTSGRDDPIKLFVRLVGEGERVMVRVGGGWADLADYLRQYAEHHGSRTVSEGNLEVQTVASAPGSRKTSGAAELNRAKSPAPPSLGTPRPSSKDSDNEWSFPVLTNGRSTPSTTGRQTPTMVSTPKSSSGSSRPSTGNVSRPPSRQNTGEVGLSGPSSGKKSALPEQKAKWVEGMIERAKQASAEKSKDEKQKYFGELGKAGGTRRVIFRSSSGTGEKPK